MPLTEAQRTRKATRRCECGKRMVPRGYGGAMFSKPPAFAREWWCGGCGRMRDMGTLGDKHSDAENMAAWREANAC